MAGRVVAITGAAGGVGRALTARWLQAGAFVLAVDASARRLAELAPHPRLATLAADLATEEGAAEMVAAARRLGDFDTLVHLVGGFASASFDAPDAPEVWRRMMRVNADAAFYCYRAALGALRERGGGWIVGIASRAARVPPAGLAAYAASKAALIAMTESLSEEAKGAGVHANLLLASTIDTPANRAAMGDANAERWVGPDAMADAIEYLCSERARALFGATIEAYGLG